MVVISLIPHRGNHQRFFPHAGFLGLTPVIVQGVVKTVLEEDQRPLKARSLIVRLRCYEADISSGPAKSSKSHVLYEASEEVWSKSDGEEWGQLGDEQLHFQITIPPEAGGVSTTTYKAFRTWWQVEAVAFHKPSPLLGSRKVVAHQVRLVRLAASPFASSPPPAWTSFTPNAPVLRGLRYSIHAVHSAFGPDEPIELSILLHRDEPTVLVKKIQMSVDRYMIIDSGSCSPDGSDEDDVQIPEQSDLVLPTLPGDDDLNSPPATLHPGRAPSKTTSSGLKRTTVSPSGYLPSPSRTPTPDTGSYFSVRRASVTPSPASSSRAPVQFVATELEDAPFDTPISLAVVVPKSKSLFKYSIGETMKTKFAHIYFTLSVKLSVKTSSGRVEIIELEPQPIAITAGSNVDRLKALEHSPQLLRVAEAESRIFDNRSATPPAPPYQGAVSALGARRSSHFHLSINTGPMEGVEDDVPSPTRSLGFTSERERAMVSKPSPQSNRRTHSAVRKRSDQWDALEAPVRSRPRFSNRSSFQGSLPTPDSIGPPPYISSHLSHSTTAHYSPSIASSRTASSRTPTQDSFHPDSPSSFQRYLSATASGNFPLVVPPSPESHRQSRRSVRSSAPYSTANRPRSAGALSAMSGRSIATTSSGGSTSGLSLSSSTSSVAGRFVRESSAPLLTSAATSSLSSEILLLPLSLYPRAPVSPPLVDTPTFGFQASGLAVPSSPAPSTSSEFSSSSDAGTPPPQHLASPTIDFNSFSLQTAPAVTAPASMLPSNRGASSRLNNDVSPFDTRGGKQLGRQTDVRTSYLLRVEAEAVVKPVLTGVLPRRTSMNIAPPPKQFGSESRRGSGANLLNAPFLTPLGVTDNGNGAGRRKSSGGFGLFKSLGDEDDHAKEGGRWGFLRRASKA